VELNEAVLALARAIHAGGPDGWRTATVSMRCSAGGQGGQAGYDNRAFLAGGPAMRNLQTALTAAVLDGRREALYELVVRSTGEVRLAYTYDVSGAIVVRDKDFRLPGHPLPGSIPLPERARITDAPTDPSVLVGLPKIGDGRSEDDILAAERELGCRLPEDLRALHRLGHATIEKFRLATLEELVEWRTDEDLQFGGWDDDEPLDLDPVPDVWPLGHVKRLCRNDWWLPFAVDDNWNYLAVDLDPADHGRPGQVLWFDEHTEMSGLVADSVASMLPPWTWPGPRPEPPVQRLIVNGRDELDLAGPPTLLDLRVNGAGRVRATALPGLEALHIEARESDLTALAGHPTLWSLRLSGHEVDARLIATMTVLVRLDLAGVEVTNIEALNDLPSLKVVTLNDEQWSRVDLPNLAVAALGRADLAQRLAWLDRYDPLDRNRELHLVEALI
jgi:cell wall assembly regulator SMI1